MEIYDKKSQSIVNQIEYREYDYNKNIIDLSACKDADIQAIHLIKNDSYNLSEYNSFKKQGIWYFQYKWLIF